MALKKAVILLLALMTASHATSNAAFRDPASQDLSYSATVWVNLTSTHWWKVVTGAWADQGAITWLPGDAAVGSSPLFECGTASLTSGWLNGNLFDIKRKSDGATTTIAAINGVPDIATLASYLPGQATTCYDQSGHAANATQITLANAPEVRAVGNNVYFAFSKISPPPSGSGNYFFNLPATSWGTGFSFFQMSQLSNVIGQYAPAMFELGVDTGNFQTYYVKSTDTNSWSDETNVNITATYASTGESNPQVFAMVSGAAAGSATAYWGERAINQINWKTKGTPVGGRIGGCVQCTSGPGFLDGTVQAVIIYGSALSASNRQLVSLGMYKLFGVVPQLVNQVVITDGSSNISADHAYYPQTGITSSTAGGGGFFGMTRAIVEGKLTQPVQWINTAISGELLSSIVASYSGRDAALMNPTAANNIFIFNGGEHEADVSGQSPSTVFASLQSFYSATLSIQSNPSWSAIFYMNYPSNNNTVASSTQTISSGTYNSSTGAVTLTMGASVAFSPGYYIKTVSLTGTGAVASLNGLFQTISPTSGTTVTYQAASGLGATTITGGTFVEPQDQWFFGGGGVQGFNQLLAAGPLAGNTGFIDMASVPAMSCFGCYTNTSYYWSDGLHWGGIGSLGTAATRDLLATKINSIVSPGATGGIVQ